MSVLHNEALLYVSMGFPLFHCIQEENDPLKVVEVNKDMDMPPGELTGSFYRYFCL